MDIIDPRWTRAAFKRAVTLGSAAGGERPLSGRDVNAVMIRRAGPRGPERDGETPASADGCAALWSAGHAFKSGFNLRQKRRPPHGVGLAEVASACRSDAHWDRLIRRPSTIRIGALFGQRPRGTTMICASFESPSARRPKFCRRSRSGVPRGRASQPILKWRKLQNRSADADQTDSPHLQVPATVPN